MRRRGEMINFINPFRLFSIKMKTSPTPRGGKVFVEKPIVLDDLLNSIPTNATYSMKLASYKSAKSKV
jgi:hypothetical protein